MEKKRWTPMAEVIADLDLEIDRTRNLLQSLVRQRSWLLVEDIKQQRQLIPLAVKPRYELLGQ